MALSAKNWLSQPKRFPTPDLDGTKHGNADFLSRAAHAPFLSQREAAEVLADDQILQIGEAMEDDGQEPEEDYDSLSDSETETDPRIPYQDKFLKKFTKRLYLKSNNLIHFCLKSGNGLRTNINLPLKSINCSLLMRSFMLIVLSTFS